MKLHSSDEHETVQVSEVSGVRVGEMFPQHCAGASAGSGRIETSGSDVTPCPPTKRVKKRPQRPKCRAVKADGTPCGAYAIVGTDVCGYHCTDPAMLAKMQEARSRGGKAAMLARYPTQVPLPDFRSPSGVRQCLEEVTQQVREGRLSPSQGQAVSALVNSSLKLVEVSLDARLAKLEALLEAKEGGQD